MLLKAQHRQGVQCSSHPVELHCTHSISIKPDAVSPTKCRTKSVKLQTHTECSAACSLDSESLTSTVSASRCVLNMGGGHGTLKISNFLPLASVVDSRISTLRDEHSYCMVDHKMGGMAHQMRYCTAEPSPGCNALDHKPLTCGMPGAPLIGCAVLFMFLGDLWRLFEVAACSQWLSARTRSCCDAECLGLGGGFGANTAGPGALSSHAGLPVGLSCPQSS